MQYTLKNGRTVLIRKPAVEDAQAIIHILTQSASETPFLARNPEEFRVSIEKERAIISSVLENPDADWFVAEYNGQIVGQCSVSRVRSLERYRHRASLAFVILKAYCGLGIGGKLMETCIQWCKAHQVTQMELDVVQGNERALRMYKGFGFEITGTIPNALRYPDGSMADEYFMVKIL